jgi:hypothetical protein
MKTARVIFFALILFPVLMACGQAPATSNIYDRVTEPELKAGNSVPAPSGEVVLTIDGKIDQTNSGDSLQFDMSTLESIGLVEYDVDDPFAKKNIVYTGVLLSELLKVAGAAPDATTLTLLALDDYSTDMKISDTDKWPVLVATRADGEYMPVDKNGPLISVFPFSDFAEIDHLTYDALWVWSLSAITVK